MTRKKEGERPSRSGKKRSKRDTTLGGGGRKKKKRTKELDK